MIYSKSLSFKNKLDCYRWAQRGMTVRERHADILSTHWFCVPPYELYATVLVCTLVWTWYGVRASVLWSPTLSRDSSPRTTREHCLIIIVKLSFLTIAAKGVLIQASRCHCLLCFQILSNFNKHTGSECPLRIK